MTMKLVGVHSCKCGRCFSHNYFVALYAWSDEDGTCIWMGLN